MPCGTKAKFRVTVCLASAGLGLYVISQQRKGEQYSVSAYIKSALTALISIALRYAVCYTNSRCRSHLVAIHFSPVTTGSPPCSD